jgi:hypothetical protein
MQNDLATVYNNRGKASADRNALTEASDDYGRAIDLCVSPRHEQSSTEWPERSRALLAEATRIARQHSIRPFGTTRPPSIGSGRNP